MLEQAIELHRGGSAGTRSGAEDAYLTLGLPVPLVNTALLGFEVDFQWPERKLVVEIDGPAHRRAANRRRDGLQDASLAAAGFTTLRFADSAVHQRPLHVARRTRSALEDASRAGE